MHAAHWVMTFLHRRPGRLVLAHAIMALVAYLSVIDLSGIPSLHILFLDKFLHALAYGTIYGVIAFHESKKPIAVLFALYVCGFGILMECVQATLPYREASVADGDPLLVEYPGSHLIVRVRTTLVSPNCKRYVHRMQRIEPSQFVPRDRADTPVPSWKREEWVPIEALPRDDPARDPAREELPASPDY